MAGATKGGSLSLAAYAGDNKTLLAFNFWDPRDAASLAGFTVECKPPGQPSYYLWNLLQFASPSKHAQIPTEPSRSSANAPFQKFRWIHVPGTSHQGTLNVTGNYSYTVTPRYFDDTGCMLPLDTTASRNISVCVGPFRKGSLALGFTRGYMQSEAFVHHFGADATLQPKGGNIVFDTTQRGGVNETGQSFTILDEYIWMGASGRAQVFNLLNAVLKGELLQLRVFAYDLNEPDIVKILLNLAEQRRVRVILDNSTLHHKPGRPVKAEDKFESRFRQIARAPAEIVRGSFGRYAHDKVFILSQAGQATQVLTGSTNFSVNGLYVNANHVLVFDDMAVAGHYGQVFEESWNVLKGLKSPSTRAAAAFAKTPLAHTPFTVSGADLPKTRMTFSPHTSVEAQQILSGISARIAGEAKAERGSVLFAVMQLTQSQTPVYQALKTIFKSSAVYSYGISDSPGGIHLYAAGSKQGVLVTGKPLQPKLPPPFDRVPSVPGHEIHDKFVVCGLNGPDPVVYCGSSNLASGGEKANGDNLLEIHDQDVAAVFAIEALLLVDHYNFLDRYAKAGKKRPRKRVSGVRSGKKRVRCKRTLRRM